MKNIRNKILNHLKDHRNRFFWFALIGLSALIAGSYVRKEWAENCYRIAEITLVPVIEAAISIGEDV